MRSLFLFIITSLGAFGEFEKLELPKTSAISGIEVLDEDRIIVSLGNRNINNKLGFNARTYGLMFSNDGGETWEFDEPFWGGQQYVASDVEVDEEGDIYISPAGNGIFYTESEAGGRLARRIGWGSTGFFEAQGIEIDNGKVTAYRDRAIYISLEDPDTTFTQNLYGNLSATFLDSTYYNASINDSFHTGEFCLVSTDKGIFASKNSSTFWEPMQNGIEDLATTNITGDSDGNIYAATSKDGLFISTDLAESWQLIDGTEEFFTSESFVNKIEINDEKIYLAANDGIYVAELSDLIFNKIEEIKGNIIEVEIFDNKIYYALEFGPLMIYDGNELISKDINDMELAVGDLIYDNGQITATLRNNTILTSNDLGNTWEIKYTNPEIELYFSHIYRKGDLFIGTDYANNYYYSDNGLDNITKSKGEFLIYDIVG